MLLTMHMLLSTMTPFASAEELIQETIADFGGDVSSAIQGETLLTPLISEFEVGNNDFVATSQVNGHDYLYVPHNTQLYVYDLTTFQKVDEENIGMSESDGAFVDSNGIVWVYGQEAYLYRYDPVTGTGTKTAKLYIDGSASKTQLFCPVEINGVLYVGTYPNAHIAAYDPNTDTFTDVTQLIGEGVKVTSLSYKDGFIYAAVHAADSSQLPHALVKYSLQDDAVVASLDLQAAGVLKNAAYLTQTVIAGDVLLGATTTREKMLAVDINTLQLIDIGCQNGAAHGFSQVIKEESGNEKVYFFVKENSDLATFYEYNSTTQTATPVDGFAQTDAQFNTRGTSFVTAASAEISGEALLVGMKKDGTVLLYDLENKTAVECTGLTDGDSSAVNLVEFRAGPEGSDEIYIGCFMNNTAGVYDIKTNALSKLYPAYSEQVETSGWFGNKWYVSGYGACSVSEMDYNTGAYRVLFALNEADKLNLVQERIHVITAGDNKVFAATVPHKNILGGFVAWYDYTQETTFVAVEENKVIYQSNSDKSSWYDVVTREKIVFNTDDAGANDFTGFIENQTVNSLYYQNGYLYGTTYIAGGSGSMPEADSNAELFVYDVANMQMVVRQKISDAIEELATPVELISVFAPDPEIEGKFWGVVAQTLFTATFDAQNGSVDIQEILSYGKSSYKAYMSKYKTGQIYFDNGYILVNFRSSNPNKPESDDTVDALRIINMNDPDYRYTLSTQSLRAYVLGNDGNVYYENNDGVSVLYTADMIQAIQQGKEAVTSVVELISSIDATVTQASKTQIDAARAAYEELTDNQKLLVSNYETLRIAERALDALQNRKYTFTNSKSISIRTSGESGTNLTYDPAAPTLNIPEGYCAWEFAGRSLSGKTGSADGTRVNIKSGGLTVFFDQKNAKSSTNGDWIALKLTDVPAGYYRMVFTNVYSEYGGKADVYMMNADTYESIGDAYLSLTDTNAESVRVSVNNTMKTLLSDIDENKVANAKKLGSFDSTKNPAVEQDLGIYHCDRDGDYVLVFRCGKLSLLEQLTTSHYRLCLGALNMVLERAQIGTQTYASLEDALDAAGNGDKVSLLRDNRMESLAVPTGVTFDLNGYALTVGEFTTAAGGTLTDSTGGDGLLIAEDGSFAGDMPVANNILPLYDAENGGYRLVTYCWGNNDQVQANGKLQKFWFQITFEKSESGIDPYQLIAVGDTGLSIGVKLAWGEDNERQLWFGSDKGEGISTATWTQDWGQWAYELENRSNLWLYVNVSGAMDGLSVTPMIESQGVYDDSNAIVYKTAE